MAIKTVADLKKELHKNGIKTYRNKKTNASYVKRTDINKILADKKTLLETLESYQDETILDELVVQIASEAGTKKANEGYDDDLAQDEAEKIASDINNGGLPAQIDYLLDEGLSEEDILNSLK